MLQKWDLDLKNRMSKSQIIEIKQVFLDCQIFYKIQQCASLSEDNSNVIIEQLVKTLDFRRMKQKIPIEDIKFKHHHLTLSKTLLYNLCM